jgi:hypothetical protein
MPLRTERSPRRLAMRGLLGVLLILAIIPMYLAVAPSWRPVVVRLACTGLVVVGCIRVIRGVRRAIQPDALLATDPPPPAPPSPTLDAFFLRLRGELTFSVRSRRYFDAILWPRLLALAGTDLPRPAERRRILRRGPPLATLERLIAEIERRA